MPENKTSVDPFNSERHFLEFFDSDGNGSLDGYHKVLTWTLYDLPYPANPLGSDGVFNDFNEAIGDKEKNILNRLGKMAEKLQVTIVKIKSHSSKEGSAEKNYDLATQRAEAVKSYLDILVDQTPELIYRTLPGGNIEVMGEFLPIVNYGERDHPLNRRVEITFEIIANFSDPDRSDAKGKTWRISYDAGMSFGLPLLGVIEVGGEIGSGFIELLDEHTASSFPTPVKKEFFYLSGGVSYGFDGSLGKKSEEIREKPGDVNKAEKSILALTTENKNIDKITSEYSPNFIENFKKGWDKYMESPPKSDKTKDQAIIDILSGFGLYVSLPFGASDTLDGRFITKKPRYLSEMDLSNQVLIQLGMKVQLISAGISVQLTGVLMYIYDTEPNQVGEWVTTAILWSAADFGLGVGVNIDASVNLSTFRFKGD